VTLNEYLKAHSQSSTHVLHCIQTLARAYPDLARALQTDPNVKKADWAALCGALCKVGPVDPDAVQDAVREWGRAPGRALSGPPARLKGAAKLASCVSLDELSERLGSANIGKRPRGKWQGWIRAQARRADLRAQQRTIGARAVGRFVMWATFDPNAPRGDPAGHLPSTGDNAAACVGFEEVPEPGALCILKYKVGASRPLRLPTAATAAAADPWNSLWRPAGRGAAYGMALPRRDWPDPSTAPAGCAKPYGVPEVVHEPVTGADLCDPIELR